ncbi:MAG: hypothetical protein ACXVGH_13140 [Mycobacteriales bacterium]
MHAPAALHLDDTHPLDAVLAVVTFALGAVGLVLVAVDTQATARTGMALGAVGVLTGLAGQLLSRTRPERFLDVIGLVAAALAFALGAANAGLTFPG